MEPIRRRGDLQDAADRLGPEPLAMPVDEGLQDLMWRSSSAWAKNALANFRISLALRSSRTSRSSSCTRWAHWSPRPRARRYRPQRACPIRSASVAHSQFWARWIRWPPTATCTLLGAPAPSSPRAHAPRARTCSTC